MQNILDSKSGTNDHPIRPFDTRLCGAEFWTSQPLSYPGINDTSQWKPTIVCAVLIQKQKADLAFGMKLRLGMPR